MLPTSLALGSFDGLHAGHLSVIEKITKDTKGVPTVVSFWPHPREILYGEARLRIDLPSEKTFLLEPFGVKQLVLIPFDRSLAALKAEDFVMEMLLKTLKARQIAVGANFRFGRNREGDAIQLKELAERKGVEVSVLPIINDSNGRMSSSRIRLALQKGLLNEAKKLMGRAYKFSGKVVSGKGIGRKIGWPTANLSVDGRKFLPGLGVYAAWAWINDQKTKFPSVMNLGPQPTVDPNAPSAVEIHLLNQQIDLRECELTIEPVERLRGQKRFKDLDELSCQIALDAELANTQLKTYEQQIEISTDKH